MAGEVTHPLHLTVAAYDGTSSTRGKLQSGGLFAEGLGPEHKRALEWIIRNLVTRGTHFRSRMTRGFRNKQKKS